MESMFITPEVANYAILLVDTSGSTSSQFTSSTTVYDRIVDLVKTLPEPKFRIIFWNSTFIVYPYVVNRESIVQTMKTVGKVGGETCPELAFNNVPDEWYVKNGKTTVYYITDGEIGSSHTVVANSIKNFVSKNLICLNILTVERKDTNLADLEEINKAAGNDVYKLLVANNLTGNVNKFTSYTLRYSDGYSHIDKNTAPIGFIPYGSNYFSELRVNEFLVYLKETIDSSTSEDILLKIIQNLAVTLSYLVRDKPFSVRNDIISNFATLFKYTSIDSMLVNYMLVDSVQKEIIGQASVFSSYRAQLKDLFRQANLLLQKDVKQSIGMEETFVTFPINGKIIVGNKRQIDNSVTIGKNKYPNSSIVLNNVLIPCFPTSNRIDSLITNQCTRQWLRVVFSQYYKLDAQNDILIYVVLGTMLKVVLSDVNDLVKNSYRTLATIMLQKKRLNTDQTELEKLEKGDLPVPNSGKIEHFYQFMDTVNNQLGLTLRPFTLWYAICIALNNSKLIQTQTAHCLSDVNNDFPNIDSTQVLITLKPKVQMLTNFEIPSESALDYNCIITLESIEDIGGYKFLEHTSSYNAKCCPVYVISERGYHGMFGENNWATCPICYTRLGSHMFELVGPKPKINFELFNENVVDVFRQQVDVCKEVDVGQRNDILSDKSFIVVMKGTVGSGKSTYSAAIKKYIESIGGYCTVQGTDQYCKNGASFKEAAGNVRAAFNKALSDSNNLRVVVVDTCGERSNGMTFFDINFKGWKKIEFYPNLDNTQMAKYFAWSLRNVIRRGKPSVKDNWYLNSTAGIQTCIDVHNKKASSLFNKNDLSSFKLPLTRNRDDVLSFINSDADEYQNILDSKGSIDDIIRNLFSGKI